MRGATTIGNETVTGMATCVAPVGMKTVVFMLNSFGGITLIHSGAHGAKSV